MIVLYRQPEERGCVWTVCTGEAQQDVQRHSLTSPGSGTLIHSPCHIQWQWLERSLFPQAIHHQAAGTRGQSSDVLQVADQGTKVEWEQDLTQYARLWIITAEEGT